MESRTIRPGTAVLLVAAGYLLAQLSGVLVIQLFPSRFGLGASMILAELLVAAVPLAYLIRQKVAVKEYVGFEASLKSVLLGVALGVLLLFFSAFASLALTAVFGTSEAVERSNEIIAGMAASPEGLATVVTSLVLAGVCEEFAFRGFLQNSLNRKYSFRIAVLLSSIAFGLAHFDPQLVYTISTFLIGLMLGYVYRRYRYTTTATAHVVLNLIVLFLVV